MTVSSSGSARALLFWRSLHQQGNLTVRGWVRSNQKMKWEFIASDLLTDRGTLGPLQITSDKLDQPSWRMLRLIRIQVRSDFLYANTEGFVCFYVQHLNWETLQQGLHAALFSLISQKTSGKQLFIYKKIPHSFTPWFGLNCYCWKSVASYFFFLYSWPITFFHFTIFCS